MQYRNINHKVRNNFEIKIVIGIKFDNVDFYRKSVANVHPQNYRLVYFTSEILFWGRNFLVIERRGSGLPKQIFVFIGSFQCEFFSQLPFACISLSMRTLKE